MSRMPPPRPFHPDQLTAFPTPPSSNKPLQQQHHHQPYRQYNPQQHSHRIVDKQLPPSPPKSAGADIESFESSWYEERNSALLPPPPPPPPPPPRQQQQQIFEYQYKFQHQKYQPPLELAQSPPRTAANPGAMIEFIDLPAPHSGHIRVLQLHRPAAANAISYALLAALRKEVQAIQSQYSQITGAEMPWTEEDIKGPTRALVIASSVDSCFSAGADLKELASFSQEQTSAFLSAMRDTFKALANLPIPTISAIGSAALGSGFELALATHFRVFSSTASVALPETGLGIIPAAGGTHRLAALVGQARAREIVMTSRRVYAQEAYTLGIATRLVDVSDLDVDGDEGGDTAAAVGRRKVLVEAIRLAEEVCEGAPVAVRAALQALRAPGEENEKAMCERVFGSEDWGEALRAFQEKRKPAFKGR